MRNEEIITRLNNIKKRAKSQKRDQCVTIILTPDGFVKMFDASGTVKKSVKEINFKTESTMGTQKEGQVKPLDDMYTKHKGWFLVDGELKHLEKTKMDRNGTPIFIEVDE